MRALNTTLIFSALGIVLFAAPASAGYPHRQPSDRQTAQFDALASNDEVVHDRVTQMIVLGCSGMYLIAFILITHWGSGKHFWRLDNADVWMSALAVLAAFRYALSYDSYAGGTAALRSGCQAQQRAVHPNLEPHHAPD